ncbi:MAG: hypothetical protein SO072_13690 [Dysosmobacter sp.]|nr:hypothetical protein [Dysosmobacter sp.]
MNEFQRLLAYLKIAYNNLTTLHRNLVHDAGWFGDHEQLGDWYGQISDQLDDLTETGISLSFAEPSIKDAVLAYSGDVITCDPRELPETLRIAQSILLQTADMMRSAEGTVPAAVANKLQEYEYHWNKEANYKIAHAIGSGAGRGGPVAEDDDD